MSDTTEATAALEEVENLIAEAKSEKDPAQRLGKILLVKECSTQAVKFARRAFLASAGFGKDESQADLPLPGDEPRGGRR